VTLPPLPPWRAQDVGDVMLGRPSRPTPDLNWLTGADIAIIEPADAEHTVYIVQVPGADGGWQQLVWRMCTHVHGQDCTRA
jgi:hypothetical protein